VSVVMPVFNGAEYLVEAIESVLDQSFREFELLLINDGSTDRTGEIMDQYATRDPRVIVHHQENRGLVACLNHGFEVSNGEFIARMDGDDISLPERFQAQVEFLDQHPDVGVCGTGHIAFGEGQQPVVRVPTFTDHDHLACHIMFRCCFIHPDVMLRRIDFVKNGLFYDPIAAHVEDYDLWVRAVKYVKFAKLRKPLLKHRTHIAQVTQRHRPIIHENVKLIHSRQLAILGLNPTNAELETHVALANLNDVIADATFLKKVDNWFRKLEAANSQSGLHARDVMASVLAQEWWFVCGFATRKGIRAAVTYFRSPFSKKPYARKGMRASILLASVLRKPVSEVGPIVDTWARRVKHRRSEQVQIIE